ncbi:hypothetical protein F5B19DRAFT_494857 [Rostrohypoxylon terebratum]|nr:hypothetical protein F5B19DRAFT_494857 [Rostrohypoxylon terebratum]
MKSTQLRLIATSLWLPFALGAIRTDLQRRNVEVAEIDKNAHIDHDNQEIVFKEGGDFEDVFRCTRSSGKRLTFTADNTVAACCLPGQRLLGTLDTAFDCCAPGHSLTGTDRNGYKCCPTGQFFDGLRCGGVCMNGRVMVDGQCVCPPGTSSTADGSCKALAGCDSGITTGACYLFRMENGHTFGYDSGQLHYSAADHSNQHRLGKFKLCKNERCTPGSSVDPHDAIRIKDVQGTITQSSETQGNRWLNKASEGNHIGRTARFEDAGVFTITKWACGEYCLGGYDDGVTYAFPSETPSLTFTQDRQACTPIEILEVPCDIHSIENNCMWEKVPGTCGPGSSGSCHCPKGWGLGRHEYLAVQ